MFRDQDKNPISMSPKNQDSKMVVVLRSLTFGVFDVLVTVHLIT